MSFSHQGREIRKVAVIGSGQIGPDIALYFSKVLSPFDVQTVVVDVSADALAGGQKKLEKKKTSPASPQLVRSSCSCVHLR